MFGTKLIFKGTWKRGPKRPCLSPETSPGPYSTQTPVSRIVHERSVKFLLKLRVRKPGQGDRAEHEGRDLRSQLLEAEAVHFDKARGESSKDGHASTAATQVQGDTSESHGTPDSDAKEAPDAKRRRVLTETRALDAESEASESDASEERCAAALLSVTGECL